MDKNILLEKWNTQLTRQETQYDIFIAAVGYELRSRYIAENFLPNAKSKVATAFIDNRILNFKKNYEFYSKAGFKILDHSNIQFNEWIKSYASDLKIRKDDSFHLLVDISSMTRHRIAAIVAALRSYQREFSVVVDFVYALAAFTGPLTPSAPIIKAGPVTKDFAGWSVDPDMPNSLIIGLGYEDVATGAVEYIEPGDLWLMIPTGGDKRYILEIEKANKELLNVVSKQQIFEYNILRPFELFTSLESLCVGAMRFSRPVIVPFGPKIFTLCSLLISSIYDPNISVWRITSGKYGQPSDRIPTGEVIGLRVNFLPLRKKEEVKSQYMRGRTFNFYDLKNESK